MIDAKAVTTWRKKRRRAPGQVEREVCERLRVLASQVPADQAIVELGAYKGRATGWLLLGAEEGCGAHVTTVDPWGMRQDAYAQMYPAYASQDTYRQFREHMERIGATRKVHTVRRAYAANVGRRWDLPPVGLLWHDAEHSADAVAEDLAAWAPHVAPGGVVVLHDAGRHEPPVYEVLAGAARVLDAPGWDWAGRELVRWKRHPGRRGALIVRREDAE